MKNLKISALLILAILSISSCDKDDEPKVVEPVVEEEVITTVIAEYTPEGGGDTVKMEYRDLDGDGPNLPKVNVTGSFLQNKTYNGEVTILNEIPKDPENITEEIRELSKEHQLFYQKTGNLPSFEYAKGDVDGDGKPLGLLTVFKTGNAAKGNLIITLRHLLNKSAPNVAAGDITNAGGSTDFEVTFENVEVK